MKKLLSKRRFEVLALAIALVCAILHRASDSTPVIGDEFIGAKPAFGKNLFRGISTLESRATDIQFQVRGPTKPHEDVVVVAIDEKAAQKYGLWPWPRDVVGQALT